MEKRREREDHPQIRRGEWEDGRNERKIPGTGNILMFLHCILAKSREERWADMHSGSTLMYSLVADEDAFNVKNGIKKKKERDRQEDLLRDWLWCWCCKSLGWSMWLIIQLREAPLSLSLFIYVTFRSRLSFCLLHSCLTDSLVSSTQRNRCWCRRRRRRAEEWWRGKSLFSLIAFMRREKDEGSNGREKKRFSRKFCCLNWIPLLSAFQFTYHSWSLILLPVKEI